MTDNKPYIPLDGEMLQAAVDLYQITGFEEPALAERKAKAKALLANTLTTPGFEAGEQDGTPLVMVRNGSSSFKVEKAQAELPKKLFDSICADVPDMSKAAAVLNPEEYRSICILMPNADLAQATLTPEKFALLCSKVPSAKLAEELLPPALFDKCKETGAPIIQAITPKKRK